MKLPPSWSSLTWQQLCDCWQVKLRYGGNPDAARVVALLTLCGLEGRSGRSNQSNLTGETHYTLRDSEGRLFTTTARELSQMAKQALQWFDYPYGDPGEPAEKDEKGNVTKEARNPVNGYVNPDYDKRDALALPVETLTVRRRHFALPQVACVNYTWQQYRALQGLASMLFQEGNTEEQTIALQAQFLAHSLVPRSLALFDTNAGSIRFRPHWEYQYNSAQADGLARWWEKRLSQRGRSNQNAQVLFHICFQAYHTAILQYEKIYPVLFAEGGKSDPLRTAISGEGDTITAIMDEGKFSSPQDVYDANLPFVLSVLNRMAKKAKELEKINAKAKRKR